MNKILIDKIDAMEVQMDFDRTQMNKDRVVTALLQTSFTIFHNEIFRFLIYGIIAKHNSTDFPKGVSTLPLLKYQKDLMSKDDEYEQDSKKGSNQQVEILKQDDPISYKSLLKESFICCEKIETLEIEKSNEKCPVRDIVNRFTANFVRAPSTSKDQNCLCLGYRSKGSFSDAIMRNYIDIECTFVNTIQSIVTSQTWQILADRIGESAMRQLLMSAIFVKTINGSYIQVCGVPANDLAFRFNNGDFNSSASSLKKHSTNANKFVKLAPSTKVTLKGGYNDTINGNTKLPRFRMLYNNRRDTSPGLPSNHHFVSKCTEDLVEQIVSLEKFQYLDKAMVKTILTSMINLWKVNFQQFNFFEMLRKYCPNPLHATNKTKPSTKNTDVESRKTKRGCRAGKKARERKDRESQKKLSANTKTAAIIPKKSSIRDEKVQTKPTANSLTCCNIMDVLTPLDTEMESTDVQKRITIGAKVFSQLMANIDQDVDLFKTQDSQLMNISLNSHNTNNATVGSAPNVTRSQKARQRRKAKRQKLLQESMQSEGTGVSTLTGGSTMTNESMLSIAPSEQIFSAPSKISDAVTIKNDIGKVHHYNRKYPTVVMEEAKKQDAAAMEIETSMNHTTKPTNNKELWEYATPVDSVVNYVTMCVRYLFPLESMWGCRKNWNKILSIVTNYIKLGRAETYTINQILHGIEISQLPWIQKLIKHQATLQLTKSTQEDDGSSGNNRKKRKYDTFLNQEYSEYQMLVEHIVYYVFTNIIHYLLSNVFYITECEQKNCDLFYFLKPVWFEKVIEENLGAFQEQFMPVVFEDPIPPQVSSNDNKVTTMSSSSSSFPRAQTLPVNNTISSSFTDFKRSRSSLPSQPAAGSVHTTQNNNTIQTKKSILTLPRVPSFMTHVPLVRFVPKKSTLRIITNLKTKSFPPGTAAASSSFKKLSQSSSSSSSAANSMEVLTNAKLYQCLHVMKHIYDYYTPYVAGFSAFGLDDIYQHIRRFREHQAMKYAALGSSSSKSTSDPNNSASQKRSSNSGASMPKYYIATLDIEKCYDNIDTSLLYDIIKSILLGTGTGHHTGKKEANHVPSYPGTTSSSHTSSSTSTTARGQTRHQQYLLQNAYKVKELQSIYPGYMTEESIIHKYYITHTLPSMQRIVSQPIRYVSLTSGDLIPFAEASQEIAKHYPASIITDCVYYTRITPQEILKLLQMHLFQHMVKLPIAYPCATTTTSSSESVSEKTKKRKKLRKDIPKKGKRRRFDENQDGEKNAMMNEEPDQLLFHTPYATQMKGIPQGSVLSPILCNYYYGYLENLFFHAYYPHLLPVPSPSPAVSASIPVPANTTKVPTNAPHHMPPPPPDFHEDPYGLYAHDSMIVRLIDDYMIVTTDPTALENILTVFFQEYAFFGGRIHPQKIKINIDMQLRVAGGEYIQLTKNIFSDDDDDDNNVANSSNSSRSASDKYTRNIFTWCGLKMDTRTLICMPDISRLLSATSFTSITNIYEITSIGKQLQRMIKSFVRMKYHSILLDEKIMFMNHHPTEKLQCVRSEGTKAIPYYYGSPIIANLYQLYLVVALRVVAYMMKLHKYYKMITIRSEHLFRCIQDGLSFAGHLLAVRTERKISRKLEFHQSKQQSYPTVTGSKTPIASGDETTITHFGKCPVTPTEAVALGWTAFVEVFRRYPLMFHNHHRVLPWMEKEWKRSRYGIPLQVLLPPSLREDCHMIILSNCQWGLKHGNQEK